MLTLNPAKLPSPETHLQTQSLLRGRTAQASGALLSMQLPSAPPLLKHSTQEKASMVSAPSKADKTTLPGPPKLSFSIDLEGRIFPPAPPSEEPAAHSVLCSSCSLRSELTLHSRACGGTPWADSTLLPPGRPRHGGPLAMGQLVQTRGNRALLPIRATTAATCCLQVHGKKRYHSCVCLYI